MPRWCAMMYPDARGVLLERRLCAQMARATDTRYHIHVPKTNAMPDEANMRAARGADAPPTCRERPVDAAATADAIHIHLPPSHHSSAAPPAPDTPSPVTSTPAQRSSPTSSRRQRHRLSPATPVERRSPAQPSSPATAYLRRYRRGNGVFARHTSRVMLVGRRPVLWFAERSAAMAVHNPSPAPKWYAPRWWMS